MKRDRAENGSRESKATSSVKEGARKVLIIGGDKRQTVINRNFGGG
jgi:hypothetical protein